MPGNRRRPAHLMKSLSPAQHSTDCIAWRFRVAGYLCALPSTDRWLKDRHRLRRVASPGCVRSTVPDPDLLYCFDGKTFEVSDGSYCSDRIRNPGCSPAQPYSDRLRLGTWRPTLSLYTDRMPLSGRNIGDQMPFHGTARISFGRKVCRRGYMFEPLQPPGAPIALMQDAGSEPPLRAHSD